MKINSMTWRAGPGKYISSEQGHYFARLSDETYIEVHPDVYNQAFYAYVRLRGIRPTTWSQIMEKADAEWQAYSRLMDAFAEDTQQWFTYRDPGVFIDLPSGQEIPQARTVYDTCVFLPKERKTLSGGRRKMIWHAGHGRHGYSYWGYHSVYLEDGTRIEVDSKTYDQRFNAYLKHLGVKPTTWSQIMEKADVKWRDYYHLMDTFAENIQQWLTFRGEGVFVMHPALKK
ncbi:MAG TPA: hypothetical protein VFA10_29365 [Ktedonobacteraceae bacterium]|nr:hypothetical protein [Ktedonobacteraceae bacterium]